jgi:hypothetical protein
MILLVAFRRPDYSQRHSPHRKWIPEMFPVVFVGGPAPPGHENASDCKGSNGCHARRIREVAGEDPITHDGILVDRACVCERYETAL